MRFGESCDLHYWWYYQSKRINKRISIPLEHGDMYIMNFKATGNDWKKKYLYIKTYNIHVKNILYSI